MYWEPRLAGSGGKSPAIDSTKGAIRESNKRKRERELLSELSCFYRLEGGNDSGGEVEEGERKWTRRALLREGKLEYDRSISWNQHFTHLHRS